MWLNKTVVPGGAEASIPGLQLSIGLQGDLGKSLHKYCFVGDSELRQGQMLVFEPVVRKVDASRRGRGFLDV